MKAKQTSAPSIQFHSFPDGGFVLHKITGPFVGFASAWYDKHGSLLDAEQRTGRGVYPVSTGGPIGQYLQKKGSYYAGYVE